MADDLTKKKPLDAKKVNLSQQWEIDYWCDKFNCTETKLKAAVKSVGNSAEKVKEHLKK